MMVQNDNSKVRQQAAGGFNMNDYGMIGARTLCHTGIVGSRRRRGRFGMAVTRVLCEMTSQE